MKKKTDNKSGDFVCKFSDEKLNEFKDMPLKTRLQWLEEADAFINKALGFTKKGLV